MSLTAILKKIEKVDQKHKEIIMRYNSASRECPRQHELEREEQEDQRIFGILLSIKVTLAPRYSASSSREKRISYRKPGLALLFLSVSSHRASAKGRSGKVPMKNEPIV